jgi:RHS repeat-associated protein
VKTSIKYDAFGQIVSETAAAFRGWYGYTGREIEKEIDLQYNHARWYNAKIGKWMTEDPLGFDAGDTNLYRYVENKSSVATDPSGLELVGFSETSARDYLVWLKGEQGILEKEYGKGPGIKGLSISKAPTGRYIFLYEDNREIENAMNKVGKWDQENLKAMMSTTDHRVVWWAKSKDGPFNENGQRWSITAEGTSLSHEEKVFINQVWGRQLYDVAQWGRTVSAGISGEVYLGVLHVELSGSPIIVGWGSQGFELGSGVTAGVQPSLGLGAAASVQAGWNNAKSITELNGSALEIGGGIEGVPISGAYQEGVGPNGPTYQGFNIGVGITKGGGVFAGDSSSVVWRWFHRP